jgi:hypothetical protein
MCPRVDARVHNRTATGVLPDPVYKSSRRRLTCQPMMLAASFRLADELTTWRAAFKDCREFPAQIAGCACTAAGKRVIPLS